jgi:hypothetical protein
MPTTASSQSVCRRFGTGRHLICSQISDTVRECHASVNSSEALAGRDAALRLANAHVLPSIAATGRRDGAPCLSLHLSRGIGYGDIYRARLTVSQDRQFCGLSDTNVFENVGEIGHAVHRLSVDGR